jgi:hypothetical protein
MGSLIAAAKRPVKVLNLFGYTGLASLVAARAGAEVTHVDASKKAIGWARENQEMARLSDKPIRWIVEDAMKFAEREERRGNGYDIILFDPPAYGRGPKGEVWQLFEDLPAPDRHLPRHPVAETTGSRADGLFDPRVVLRHPRADARHLRRHGRHGGIGRTHHPRKGRGPGALDLAVLAVGGGMSQRETGRVGQVKEVTSLANPLVKDIKALALKKFRDQQNAFMAEGLKLVIDALDLGWTIRTLIFAKSGNRQPDGREGRRAHRRSRRDRAGSVGEGAFGDHPARQSADRRRRLHAALPAAEIRQAEGSDVWVALDRVRDPGNLGTIIRTADAVGARASSSSATPPIPSRWKPCAPRWARSSPCRW